MYSDWDDNYDFPLPTNKASSTGTKGVQNQNLPTTTKTSTTKNHVASTPKKPTIDEDDDLQIIDKSHFRENLESIKKRKATVDLTNVPTKRPAIDKPVSAQSRKQLPASRRRLVQKVPGRIFRYLSEE